MATLPKCSRRVPNSCMWRCAHMPMTSTGRTRPQGTCSALSSRTSPRSCAHGRDVVEGELDRLDGRVGDRAADVPGEGQVADADDRDPILDAAEEVVARVLHRHPVTTRFRDRTNAP